MTSGNTSIIHCRRRGNRITIETESERDRDCTQRFIKDKYMLFISTRATLLQRYPSANIKDVANNKVVIIASVKSKNRLFYVLLANNKNRQLQIPMINLHSLLVSYILCWFKKYNQSYLWSTYIAELVLLSLIHFHSPNAHAIISSTSIPYQIV